MKRVYFKNLFLLSLILTVFFSAGVVHADTDLMLLVDASNSMTSPGTPGTSHNKFDEVKSAITVLLQSLPPDVSVGLRLMGNSPASDCYSSFSFSSPRMGDRSRLQDFLDSVRPAGVRGLYQGIDDSRNDFGNFLSDTDRVLLIITDGGDGCDRDLGTLGRQYQYDALAPQIIVFGLDLDEETRDSIGEIVRATGGRLTNIDDLTILPDLLDAFADEFVNNLRVYLADTDGNAVNGDVVVKNQSTGEIVGEYLDVTDFSLNVPAGTYVVEGRYRGAEVQSDTIMVSETGNYSINLDFNIYVEPFTLVLKDLFEQPLRARVTFLNSSREPVLTTALDTSHRVELPADSYTIEVRLGDITYDFAGIMIGPGYSDRHELTVPVTLGVMEVEVTNMWGTPLNAEVTIYDSDGTIMDQAPYTSYLYARIPPGTYRVVAEYAGRSMESTIYLASGDQMQVPLEIDIDLGDIFVMLRTESGDDAWGWVKLYDSNGNLFDRYDRETIEQPDWSFADIPVGMYTLEAEVDGIVRTRTGVEVRDNQETEIEITFPDEVY